jgi:adhesin/invasin
MIMLGACGDKVELVNVGPLVGTIAVVSGDLQTGVVGQALANPVVVSVVDQNGLSLIGAIVSWEVIGASGSVSSPTSTTDVNGQASVIWTLGTEAGTDSLRATLANGSSVIFTATATAEDAGLNLAIVSGNNQNVAVGAASAPMVIRATDDNGNPLTGVVLSWAGNNGTLSAASTTTGADGLAQVTVTPASAGSYTVSASLNASTTPIIFSGTAFVP